MSTPSSIVPEWYLLPFYAILRSIPNKLLGVIAMFGSLLILLILPITDLSRIRVANLDLYEISSLVLYCKFLYFNVDWSLSSESPYLEIGQIATSFYFIWFLVIVPVLGILENTLFDIATIN